MAVENGLRLPIVYNTSSYDSMRSLELLDGLVDIYMPDFKVKHLITNSKIAHFLSLYNLHLIKMITNNSFLKSFGQKKQVKDFVKQETTLK